MTRIMYDSAWPSLIPADAGMVAGYTSGQCRWSKADWDRFPHAVKIRIDVDGSEPWLSDVIDCEKGDLSPADAVDWCMEREIKRGWWSCIYTSMDNWDAVLDAVHHVGAVRICYWIAAWDGKEELITGSVAHQYASTARWDVSVVDPGWFKASAPGWSIP